MTKIINQNFITTSRQKVTVMVDHCNGAFHFFISKSDRILAEFKVTDPDWDDQVLMPKETEHIISESLPHLKRFMEIIDKMDIPITKENSE